jgi:hypothetical protein
LCWLDEIPSQEAVMKSGPNKGLCERFIRLVESKHDYSSVGLSWYFVKPIISIK